MQKIHIHTHNFLYKVRVTNSTKPYTDYEKFNCTLKIFDNFYEFRQAFIYFITKAYIDIYTAILKFFKPVIDAEFSV